MMKEGMDSWSSLSMAERAEVMKLALENGISDLGSIRNVYNEYASGGKIHIKPENRGKFTALKKRTGHSASWFKAHGTPAQKKMATFALNARKWKHEDGGYLNLFKGGGSKNPAAEKAMKYFMSKGLARHQAAGLIGNLMRESGLNPTAYYHDKDGGAYGIAQWRGDRRERLFAKYGNKPSFDQQLDYIWEELNSSHKSGLRHLLASKNAEEAARMGMGYYEFSAGPEGAIAAMNRWGQDGEGSMRKGIVNANQLMSLFPPTTSETILTTTPKESVSPDSSIFTVPAFSTSVYIPSEAPQLPTPDLKSIEDRYREAEDRRQAKIQKFNVLNSLMGMAEQNNGYTGLESLLNTRYTNTDPLLSLTNEYALGRHIYDGTTEPTQQMDNDYIFTGQPSQYDFQITAPKPTVYWDGFNWIGFDDLGQRVTKGKDFNPSGATVVQDPERFEKERLAQAARNDINRTNAFAETLRDFTTGLVAMPAGDVIAEPLGILGEKALRAAAKTKAGKAVMKGIGRVASKFTKRKPTTPAEQWAVGTPQITAENAASMTNDQWNAAYKAAYEAGDVAEGQRLWDLWFKQKTSHNKVTEDVYHGTPETFNSFDLSLFGKTDPGTFGRGIYLTPTEHYAGMYGDNVMRLKVNMENPGYFWKYSPFEDAENRVAFGADRFIQTGRDGIIGTIRQGDLDFPYTEVVSHNPKNVKSAEPFTKADDGSLINLTDRADFSKNDIRYDWSGNQTISTDAQYLLSKEKEMEISKYANSKRNPVTQMNERMSSPEYAAMIKENTNPEYRVEGEPIYFEGYKKGNKKELLKMIRSKIEAMPIRDSEKGPLYEGMLKAVYGKGAASLPHSNYVYISPKNRLLSQTYITPSASNSVRQHQYGIIKAHDGSHSYNNYPKEVSPMHYYLNDLDKYYFEGNNDAEIAARGTQIKNYFDKNTISADELKYAAEHYVEDTGIDNNMTSLFNQLKQAATKDSRIWEKMAIWISKVSPIAVAGIITNKALINEDKKKESH